MVCGTFLERRSVPPGCAPCGPVLGSSALPNEGRSVAVCAALQGPLPLRSIFVCLCVRVRLFPTLQSPLFRDAAAALPGAEQCPFLTASDS